MAILLSLLSAFFFACHSAMVKGGMKNSNPTTATLVATAANAAVLWVISILFVPFSVFMEKGVISLIIAGLLAPCLARYFLYNGIEKVGVSITSPIKETMQFVSAFAAVVFLGERFSLPIAIATVLSFAGVALLSSSSGQTRTAGQLQWKRKDLIFPFGAAVLYGTARIFRKLGMYTVTSSWGAGTVTTTISLLFFLVMFFFMKNSRTPGLIINSKSFFWFALGGILGGFGQVCILAALKTGDVVIVGPITTATPIFVLLLTYIFFKKSENISLRVLSGALIIVSSVIILTLHA